MLISKPELYRRISKLKLVNKEFAALMQNYNNNFFILSKEEKLKYCNDLGIGIWFAKEDNSAQI